MRSAARHLGGCAGDTGACVEAAAVRARRAPENASALRRAERANAFAISLLASSRGIAGFSACGDGAKPTSRQGSRAPRGAAPSTPERLRWRPGRPPARARDPGTGRGDGRIRRHGAGVGVPRSPGSRRHDCRGTAATTRIGAVAPLRAARSHDTTPGQLPPGRRRSRRSEAQPTAPRHFASGASGSSSRVPVPPPRTSDRTTAQRAAGR